MKDKLYRNFILDRNIMSESDLDALVETAKRDLENRRIAAENFASGRKALTEFGLSEMIRNIASKPPAKDKEN